MNIKPYERKSHYYETDKMGIIHHSNYIRWFEEARMDFLQQIGLNYKTMEDSGIIIPVLSVNCQYKSMVRFGDTVNIMVKINAYNSIKIDLSYSITDTASDILFTTGNSSHCFLSKDYKPLSLKKSYPDFHQIFEKCL